MWLAVVFFAVAAVVGLGAAGAASAATPPPQSCAPYKCADGKASLQATSHGAGVRCDFAGNAPTLGNCTNNTFEVENFGYRCSGCDWVRLYWGSNYTGAYFCLPPGYGYATYYYPDLAFNEGKGSAGYGQKIWNNIASLRWSGAC